MELAFVISAIRRYWWVIVLTTLLGLVPGLLTRDTGPPVYEARAVLLVAPPTTGIGGSYGSDPDRYVAGQLSVLRSQVLAEAVAAQLGEGYTADGVSARMSFQHEPATDVVTVVARAPVPETATALGNAYVDVYLESLRTQVSQTQQSEMDDLEEQIQVVRATREELDQQIQTAIAPYLARDPIPEIEQVAPNLATESQILDEQYTYLTDTQNELQNARLNVTTQIVQRATEPTVPVADPPNTLAVLGLVGGLFVGAVGAVVLARISPTVLGDLQAEEILHRPVVGRLPKVADLARNRASILDPLPADAQRVVDTLCVRAEASEHDLALAVVVSGPQRGSGATTVAAAMAGRFAANGANVLLVDANRDDPELSRLFPTGIGPGGDQAVRVTSLDGLLTTGAPGLLPIDDIIEAAGREANVVIFDAGPLLESGSSLRLARRADSVVLAIPDRQRVATLDTVALELEDQVVLPVWTPAKVGSRLNRSRMGSGPRNQPRPPAPQPTPAQQV